MASIERASSSIQPSTGAGTLAFAIYDLSRSAGGQGRVPAETTLRVCVSIELYSDEIRQGSRKTSNNLEVGLDVALI